MKINISVLSLYMFSLFTFSSFTLPAHEKILYATIFFFFRQSIDYILYHFFCSHTSTLPTLLTRFYFPYCQTRCIFRRRKTTVGRFMSPLLRLFPCDIIAAGNARKEMGVGEGLHGPETRISHLQWRPRRARSAKVTIYIQSRWVERPISATGFHLHAVAIFSYFHAFARARIYYLKCIILTDMKERYQNFWLICDSWLQFLVKSLK